MGLPVMEHFYTLQGEGFHQGKASYFIRLGGCNVGCSWCDVKESWDAANHPVLPIDEIVSFVKNTKAPIAVITGGEPLLYDLSELTTAIRAAGIQTNMETSGSAKLSGTWDWICLSPKKFKAPLPEIIEQADELKVIVFNKTDLEWGEHFAKQVKPGCKLYLQPEWSRQDKMMPLIIDYIKANPGWELSLQIHKYINVP